MDEERSNSFLLSFTYADRAQVEIRAANEIDEAVAHALHSSAGQGAAGGEGASAAGGDRSGVLSPPPAVKKPSRPGRGRARLTKRS